MSWDVLVFDFKGSPPVPVEEMMKLGDDYRPPLLGAVGGIRCKISAVLPSVYWTPGGRLTPEACKAVEAGLDPGPMPGEYINEDEGYSMAFGARHADNEDEPAYTASIAVRGSGNPFPVLVALAKAHSWSLLDMSTGEYIDPDNPSQEGWLGFQGYRDRCCGPRSADEASWGVMVFGFKGDAPPTLREAATMIAESRAPFLGTVREVRDKVCAFLPAIDWSGFTHTCEGDGYTLEMSHMLIAYEDEQPLPCFSIAVRGTGDAFPMLASLAKAYGWSLYDTTKNVRLDLDKPWPPR